MRPAAIGIKGWGAEGKREERSKRPATIFYSPRTTIPRPEVGGADDSRETSEEA